MKEVADARFVDYICFPGCLIQPQKLVENDFGHSIIIYVEDADVEEFDKAFPRKEKLKLPGQIF